MDHSWIIILHIAGTTQVFFFFLYFAFRKDKPGQLYFALLMAVITILIPLGYLHTSGEIIHYPYLSRVGFPVSALIGPLFYLSMRFTLDRNSKFALKYLAFFSISFFQLIYLTPYYFSSRIEKLRYIAEDLQNVHFECVVMSQVSFFGNLFFLFSTIVFLNKKYQEEKTWFNQQGKINFHFIKVLLFINIPFQLFLVSLVIANPEMINSNLITAAVSILVLIIAYLVLYHSQTSKTDESLHGLHKYDKDRMSDSDLLVMGKKIEEFINREKVYLDPEYSLVLLANSLDLAQNKTSQTINRFFGQSFPDLLNARRVQYAISLMKDENFREFNLLRIALESGFNSKSNFNSCFKKEMGTTPREYRKKINLAVETKGA